MFLYTSEALLDFYRKFSILPLWKSPAKETISGSLSVNNLIIELFLRITHLVYPINS